MDRVPKPAPFPVGTRVRYLGTLVLYASADAKTPTFAAGSEGVISEVRPGRRGTLRQLRDEDGPMYWDDTGDPILDETRDGYSVVVINDFGRCVNPDSPDWERIDSA